MIAKVYYTPDNKTEVALLDQTEEGWMALTFKGWEKIAEKTSGNFHLPSHVFFKAELHKEKFGGR